MEHPILASSNFAVSGLGLAACGASTSEAKQREFLAQLHRTLNAPASKIHNRLLRLTADSSELLAVTRSKGRA